MPPEPSEAWLQAANDRYRAEDVVPKQRPWRAWRDYAGERGLALELRDARVQRIFSWFQQNTQPGAHQAGPMFRGAFFFDACFWPLDVPVVYGTGTLDLFAALSTMPLTLKQSVLRNDEAMAQLVMLWTCCIDYAFGFEDIGPSSGGFPQNLILSGHRELCSCVGLLLSPRPNAKAAHTASFAVELFAKWLLATKDGLDEKRARAFNHNLVHLLDACRPYVPEREINAHIARARLMPPVSDRYDGAEPSGRYLWEAYLTAQTVAASLTRVQTGRDSQAALKLDDRGGDAA